MHVMKFGGASLRDGPAIERSLGIVVARASERPLVVVSAQEGVTAMLARAVDEALEGRLDWDPLRVKHRSVLRQLELPGDLLDRHLFELRAMLEELRRVQRPDRKLRDYVLSFGERMSARVVAAALRRAGHAAVPLDAYDLGLVAAREDGRAVALRVPTGRVRETLASVPGIPVVTGYLAQDAAGNLVTLGPNGSDLSAVWFGEAVGAEEVELWKNVPGFMTADPAAVGGARRIPVLGRAEAIEFALQGADVIHAGALEPAQRSGILVRIKDVGDPLAAGSRIEAETPHAGVIGIAHRSEVALVTQPLALGREQVAEMRALLDPLLEHAVELHGMDCSGREARFLVDDDARLEALHAQTAQRATIRRGLATFALVGRGVGADQAMRARVHALAARRAVELADAPGAPSPASRAFLVRGDALAPLLADVHAELVGADGLRDSHAPDERASA